ncbi:SUKH-4 family immunity protein [Kitasatospora sp. NPDC057223]|uniref:SUKH-4 family immunity protein n=1 Tax=Kitasatospora sp. NPDC057223 TaxID=3346055 RepID=UPI0036374004
MNESELLAVAKRPTVEWLESCFGPGSLWRPAEAELPVRLEDAGTRAFLTTVGVPAVRLDFMGYDSAGLKAKGMWEEDPDELFGNRYPDDDSEPACWSYCVGMVQLLHLMVRGDSGTVEIYDPDGWDHAAGYGGHAADSLPELIGALALIARCGHRLTDEDGDTDADALLDELTGRLELLGQGPEESSLWEGVLENLRDEYGDQ